MANQNGQGKITSKWWFWVIIAAWVFIAGGIYNATKKPEEEIVEDDMSEQISDASNVDEIIDGKADSTDIDDFTVGSKEWLEAKVNEVLHEGQLIWINYADYNNNFALIKFNGAESLTNKWTVRGMHSDIFDILKNIQDGVLGDVDFNVVYPMVDVYGNTKEEIVIKASFKKETIKKINFDNASYKNISIMADEWWNHPNVVLED